MPVILHEPTSVLPARKSRFNSPPGLWLYTCLIITTLLVATGCSYTYTHDAYENNQLRVLDNAPVDSDLVKIIAPYKVAIDSEMNEVVGDIGVELKRAKPESTLGNFVCDVLLKQGELVSGKDIDFAVYNYGGIRQEYLEAGPVTRGKIFELLPFENFGAIVTMDGPTTEKMIQKIIDEEGWPVAGINITVVNNIPQQVLINNKPFDNTRSYTVIMNDYMANGGDNLNFLAGQQVNVLGMTVRDMMLQYLQTEKAAGRKITEQIEGRVVYAK